VAYDFAAKLEFAQRRTEIEHLDVAGFEQRAYLGQGWAVPPPRAEEQERDELWCDADLAELILHVSRPSELRMTSQVRGHVAKDETSGMRVLFNGTEIQRLELEAGWQDLTLTLPAELQTEGENRVTFEFERARTAAEIAGGESRSGTRLSAQLRSFQIERQDADARSRVRWALQRIPEGVAKRTLSQTASAIEMTSTSALDYYMEVPPGARFRTGALFMAAQADSPGELTFRLVVTPRGGDPVVAWQQPVAYRAQETDVDVSLDAFAGQVVRLAFELETTDGSAAVGSWIAPRLVDEPPTEAREEQTAAASRLREQLRGKPVVAILIDACRADFLSCYGGREGLTPNIDRLAQEGVLFERAHSVACYTMASVSSMLANRPAWEHGTYWESHQLPSTFPTWPERFRAEGYRTIAIVHSINGSSRVGFQRGFEEMIEVYANRPRATREVPFGEEVLPPLEQVLAKDDERPLFLWLHLIEPHRPYDPPAPWHGKFSSGYEGEMDGGVAVARRIKKRDLVATDEDVTYLRSIYEENLAYIDSVLGRVRKTLDKAGVFEEAVVCLFADHGEAFLEHDAKNEAGIGHGATTYEEMNHVPLVLRLPAGKDGGRRSEVLASGLDILPTLADLVGVAPMANGKGISLVPTLVDPTHEVRTEVLSHAYVPREDRFVTMWARWWGDYKFVYHTGMLPGLYDLRRDPLERNNLIAEEPILAGYMRQALQEQVGFDLDRGDRPEARSEAIDVDEGALEQLRALGYAQ